MVIKHIITQLLPKVSANICGNGLIEAWEECDCGEDYDDCIFDNCCLPASHPDISTRCTRKPKADCR